MTNSTTITTKTDIALGNRSYARMAQLATLAHEADYKTYANAHEGDFFKAMLTMTDAQIVALIDTYNATANISLVVKNALEPVRDGSELSFAEIKNWYENNQDVAQYTMEQFSSTPFQNLFLAMTPQQRKAAVMTKEQLADWIAR